MMLPRLRDIECFLMVVEAGAFRRAAKGKSSTQSTMSRRVRRLEDQLGVSLLERGPAGVRMTNAGKVFHSQVRTVLENLSDAVEKAGRAGVAIDGVLKLGTLGSISCGVLRSLVLTIKERHPGVVVTLEEGHLTDMSRRIRSHELDALFAPRREGFGDLDRLELSAEPLVLAVSRKNGLFSSGEVSWAELAKVSFLTTVNDVGPQIRAEIAMSASQHGFEPAIFEHDVSRDTLLNMVGLDVGVALCPASWTGASYPDVTYVNLAERRLFHYMIAWSARNDNPALRRLIGLAKVMSAAAPSAPSRTPDPSP